MTAQFIAQEVLDQLVDGAAGVAELLPRVSSNCRREDATLGLALEGVDALIADVWAGAQADGGYNVNSTPRLAALRDLALTQLQDATQQATLREAYTGVTENLSDTCELIGYGLVYISERYETGDCLRELLASSPAPNRAEIEAMLDRFEVLAERRQAWLGLKKALPWLGTIAVVGIVSWLVFGRKR